MRFVALASDYDGTLADHGRISETTIHALERLQSSARKIILVTGRELGDLKRVCDHLELFDRVVVENGAVLYRPSTQGEELLCQSVSLDFVRELERRSVSPLSVGRAIVSTCEPHHTTVLEVIRQTRLDLEISFNRDAVMILPTGVTKYAGLRWALEDMGLSLRNTVGVGDAENDQTFLGACGCSVAVANALPSVKSSADWVTKEENGAGVEELIASLVETDLRGIASRRARH